jgi:hypothetical protein
MSLDEAGECSGRYHAADGYADWIRQWNPAGRRCPARPLYVALSM